LLLCKFSFLLQELLEGSTVAVLVNEIEVVDCFEHIEILNDMGTTLEIGENAYLVVGAFLKLRILFELLGANLLNGHFLFGFDIDGSEYC
jgi:hypothetical protein